MALSAGTRLGPYEILEPLGAGGMGEVYRARDTRLDRTVAIKVLPPETAADPHLKARFEREARAISALAHPNICTLHDVGEENGQTFLVMEHLVGQTLAERLKEGPLPLDQALEVATQVADALSAAHKQGIIHRDLKPGNVMLTKTGAKLLDFGLAKLRETGTDEDVESISRMPTQARPLTEEGKIVGTYPYMAPEQLEGKAVDARSDLFAFGAMLYQMVTGQRAFQGESRASLIAAIMSSQPRPIAELQPMTPPLLDRVVRRCLEKDPDERWQSAGDLAAEVRWIGDGLREDAEDSPRSTRLLKHQQVAWAMSVAIALALGAFVTSWWGAWQPLKGSVLGSLHTPVTHTVIDLPPDAPLALGGPVPQRGVDNPVIAVSPDGSQLVYVSGSAEGKRLFLRSMDSYEVRPIPGTEDATHPFFSPDGQWVGFLTTDKLKRVSLRGGAPMTLCDARTPLRANWTSEDTILFEEAGAGISRVPAGGGEPSRVTGRYGLSQVLPDGKSALVTGPAGSVGLDYADILLLSLETLETKRLIESGYDARYVPSGHLLFARSGSLMAVSFDLEHLEVSGEPVPVVSDVSVESFFGQAQFAFSDNGLLVHVPGNDMAVGKLAWIDRRGDTEFLPVPEDLYGVFDISPDGGRLAVHVANVNDYIWIYDVRRQEGRRLVAEESAGWPVWTPDGDSIAYSSWQPGDVRRILKRSVDGLDPPEELFASASAHHLLPSSWSPDGQVLSFSETVLRNGFLPVAKPGNPEWLQAQGSYLLWGADFSPDGRWVAYGSNETGRFEIWVRSFPDGDTVRQISVDGGYEPVWCQDCDELFYRRGNQWMSTAVTLEPELAWEPPRLAFETDFVDTMGRSYDVSPDGQRLLVAKRTREPIRTKLHVVHNWFEELKRLVPTD